MIVDLPFTDLVVHTSHATMKEPLKKTLPFSGGMTLRYPNPLSEEEWERVVENLKRPDSQAGGDYERGGKMIQSPDNAKSRLELTSKAPAMRGWQTQVTRCRQQTHTKRLKTRYTLRSRMPISERIKSLGAHAGAGRPAQMQVGCRFA